jgi:hypothetical protein
MAAARGSLTFQPHSSNYISSAPHMTLAQAGPYSVGIKRFMLVTKGLVTGKASHILEIRQPIFLMPQVVRLRIVASSGTNQFETKGSRMNSQRLDNTCILRHDINTIHADTMSCLSP